VQGKHIRGFLFPLDRGRSSAEAMPLNAKLLIAYNLSLCFIVIIAKDAGSHGDRYAKSHRNRTGGYANQRSSQHLLGMRNALRFAFDD
jgi:hypothetical protein